MNHSKQKLCWQAVIRAAFTWATWQSPRAPQFSRIAVISKLLFRRCSRLLAGGFETLATLPACISQTLGTAVGKEAKGKEEPGNI